MDCKDEAPGIVHPDDIPLADEVSEVGQRAAYDKYFSLAMAIPEGEVKPARFDVSLAFDNVQIGLRSLEEKRDVFYAMPGIEPNLLEDIRGYSLALLLAARRALQTADVRIEAEVSLKEMRRLRKLLIEGYRNASLAGLVPEAPLQIIVRGRGNEDAAADCVDLVALYRTHARALEGKIPVTEKDLREAERIAERVRELIALEGGVFGASSGDVKNAVNLRDRFGILLVRAHDVALNAAPFLFGKEWKDYVPTRQSRRAFALRAKRKSPKPPVEA